MPDNVQPVPDRPEAKKRNLLVLGGADGIGNWLTRRVFARLPDIDRITLMDIAPLEKIPEARFVEEFRRIEKPVDAVSIVDDGGPLSVQWRPVRTRAASPEGQLPISDYHLVMVAVPEKEVARASRAVLPSCHPGTWVFDVCSNKEKPLEAILAAAPEGVSVLGTHPLFGPLVGSMVGQTMVLVQTDRTGHSHLTWLDKVYADQGALIVETTAVKHDRNMLYVQALTHFTYMSFGKALAAAMQASDFNLGESFQLMTPPYKALMAFVGRIMATPPRIYAQIQSNPSAEPLRRRFQESVNDLADTFSGGDERTIEEAIWGIREAFDRDYVGRAVGLATAYVERLQDYYETLYARSKNGRLAIVKALDPLKGEHEAAYYPGVIDHYDVEHLYLKQRGLMKDGKYFIVYDDASALSFKHSIKPYGLPKKEPVEKTRKIHHKLAHILTEEETLRWRKDNLQHHTFDLPLVVSNSFHPGYIIDILHIRHSEIMKITFDEVALTAWLANYTLRNIILHMTVFGDRDVQACRQAVLKSLNIPGINAFREE